MKLELSKEQYIKLIELVHLGEWMANSFKMRDEFNEEYDRLMQYLLSFSKQFNVDFIEYDADDQYYFETKEFEEGLSPIIDQYDENTFWSELAERFAKRDLLREHRGPIQMTDELYGKLLEIEEKYQQEFAEHGLKNLELKKK